MNIFAKRPLFLSCMIFLACSVMGFFIEGNVKLIIIAIATPALICSLIFACIRFYSRNKKHIFLTIILVLIMVILSFGRSFSYFDIKLEEQRKSYGNEYSVDAYVSEVVYQGDSMSRYIISVKQISGGKDKHNAVLDCNFCAALASGDKITVVAIATSPDSSGARYNEMLELYSEGIFTVYTVDDESKLTVHDYNPYDDDKFSFEQINNRLSNIFTQRVGREEGRLCSALLLGNKNGLSSTTKRDFSRAGASHILALSGMHMSLIMGTAMFVIKRLTKNRWLIAIILSFLAVSYLSITGFSVSATRSVIMLLIVYLSMLVSALPDSLTSLSIAGFLIVLISPGTVLDASFWMSFAATLGILAFIPPLNDYLNEKLSKYDNAPKRKLHKIIYSTALAFATGAAALLPLLVVICIFFKEISLFSIISSVVLSVPTAAVIICSLILIPFHKIPFLSNAIVYVLRTVSRFMINFCAWVSDMEGVVYSLNYPFATLMAIIIGLAILYSLVSKHKNPTKSLIPTAVCIILCVCSMFAYERINGDTLKVSYINASSTSDVLVLSNKNDVVICDMSNGSASSFNLVLDEIYEARATEIQVIILTRYSDKHVSLMHDVCAKYRVRELWIPTPQNDEEYFLLQRIYDIAKENLVEVRVYTQDETLYAFGNISIEHTYDYIERSKLPISLISINTIREHMTYVSPAFNESSMYDIAEYKLSRSQYIVFGNKGPQTKNEYTLTDVSKVKVIAFADETRAKYFIYPEFSFSTYYLVPDEIEFYVDK